MVQAFVPKLTVPPTVSSGRIVDLLFTAGVTVISLITVIYSLLFLVVQWVSSTFSLRLTPFRDDPIVWRAFAHRDKCSRLQGADKHQTREH